MPYKNVTYPSSQPFLASHLPHPNYYFKIRPLHCQLSGPSRTACRCILCCSSIITKGIYYLSPAESLIFLSMSWPVSPAWQCVLFTRGAIKFLTCVSIGVAWGQTRSQNPTCHSGLCTKHKQARPAGSFQPRNRLPALLLETCGSLGLPLISPLFQTKYLFIWLHQVLAVAHGIFTCSMWDLVP